MHGLSRIRKIFNKTQPGLKILLLINFHSTRTAVAFCPACLEWIKARGRVPNRLLKKAPAGQPPRNAGSEVVGRDRRARRPVVSAR